jgi:hypothetical protein
MNPLGKGSGKASATKPRVQLEGAPERAPIAGKKEKKTKSDKKVAHVTREFEKMVF